MKTLRFYAILAAYVAVLVAAVVRVVQVHLSEAAKREEIENWKQSELAAIKRAGDIMRFRIALGYYDDLGPDILNRMASDMEFYKIAIHEEA